MISVENQRRSRFAAALRKRGLPQSYGKFRAAATREIFDLTKEPAGARALRNYDLGSTVTARRLIEKRIVMSAYPFELLYPSGISFHFEQVGEFDALRDLIVDLPTVDCSQHTRSWCFRSSAQAEYQSLYAAITGAKLSIASAASDSTSQSSCDDKSLDEVSDRQ